MASLAADLKSLRLQVERLQVEVSGRQSLDAVVIWDGQNEDYVNQKTSRMQEDWNGLVVHLTPELSSSKGTVDGLNRVEFEELKQQIVRALDPQAS